LTGKLKFQHCNLENSGQVLFNYVDIEESNPNSNLHGSGHDFVEWLGTLSSSLGQTYYNAVVELLKNNLSDAHHNCTDFLSSIERRSNNKNFEDSIKFFRGNILTEFVDALCISNKGYYLNGMDMLTLSLPLEYSLENNYWTIHAL
jgi:hypothetical protein